MLGAVEQWATEDRVEVWCWLLGVLGWEEPAVELLGLHVGYEKQKRGLCSFGYRSSVSRWSCSVVAVKGPTFATKWFFIWSRSTLRKQGSAPTIDE